MGISKDEREFQRSREVKIAWPCAIRRVKRGRKWRFQIRQLSQRELDKLLQSIQNSKRN